MWITEKQPFFIPDFLWKKRIRIGFSCELLILHCGFQGLYNVSKALVGFYIVRNTVVCVNNRGVVSVSEIASYFRERKICPFSAQIHSDLSGVSQVF